MLRVTHFITRWSKPHAVSLSMKYLPHISSGEIRTAAYIEKAHRLLQRRFPRALWIGSPGDPRVALSFDDGPAPRDTDALLTVLARHGVPATFFNVGERVASHPALTRTVAEAGHQLGIHGYRHRAFPLVATPTLHDELRHTQDVLADATGRNPADFRYVRPPFGWFTPATLRRLEAWRFRPVMWTVVPPHWLQNQQRTYSDITREMCDSAILVLHESLPGPPVARLTDEILSRLEDRGFTFTSIDCMWQTVFHTPPAVSASSPQE